MKNIIQEQIFPFLPQELRSLLSAIPEEKLAAAEELRLRPAVPPLLRFADSEAFVGKGGLLTDDPGCGMLFSNEELRKTVLLLTDSSFYALEEELRRGYVTLPGGHRAGLCGRAVLHNGRIRTLREISAVNIRVARPLRSLAAPLLPRLLDKEGRLQHTLIVAPPRAGKTTLLRDLTCAVSNGEGIVPMRVGLVDERSELAALRCGIPQLPVGSRTDVLDGCPKAEGIGMLLRAMGPELLVCDEIGREEDALAVEDAINAGVRLLLSAHCGSSDELHSRPVLKRLMREKAFDRIIMLSRRQGPGTVEWIKDGAMQPC